MFCVPRKRGEIHMAIVPFLARRCLDMCKHGRMVKARTTLLLALLGRAQVADDRVENADNSP